MDLTHGLHSQLCDCVWATMTLDPTEWSEAENITDILFSFF